MTYLNLFANTKRTPSTELDTTDDWKRLERFIILGSEEGPYYVAEPRATLQSLHSVEACLRADGLRVVRTVVEIANSGRAIGNLPSLQVLALAATSTYASTLTNATALAALPEVARTAADLCVFASLVDDIRGWGRGLRSAVANWYLSKPASELAYQIMKDPVVEGWTHADLLRLSHPKADTPALNAVFQWAVEGALGHLATADIRHGELRQVYAFEQVNKATTDSEVVRWIEDERLTPEMIPAQWKQSPRVWEALLENLPYSAMVSHLGQMTEVGLLGPHSAASALVVARLMDRKRVANAKVHPVLLLSAWLAYRQAHGVSNILDALEDAFHASFDNIEPTARRVCLAVDSSAPLELAAAVAMAFVRSENGAIVWGVNINAKHSFAQVCQTLSHEPRPANAALALVEARERAIAVDGFIILTGNAPLNARRALQEYRQSTGISAKLVIVAMNGIDGGALDAVGLGQLTIVGFDASVPLVIAEFLRS